MPSSSTFRHRFGSLLRAYELVGYSPGRDYRYIETNRALRRLHPDVVQSVVRRVIAAGATVASSGDTDLLRINDEFSLSIVVVRCLETSTGSLRWKVRLDQGLRPDLTIAVRMDAGNTDIRDYYVLPWLDVGNHLNVKLANDNGIALDTYRFETLEPFFDLTRRSPLRAA